MAKPNDTSKPPRSRRNQPEDSGHKDSAITTTITPGTEPPFTTTAPTSPPLTLEAAIEHERQLLQQVRAMLHCLYQVLLYADDDDSIMHADVAYTAARFINECVARLDSVNLRPLIDAIRQPLELTPHAPYHVKEPMLVYYA